MGGSDFYDESYSKCSYYNNSQVDSRQVIGISLHDITHMYLLSTSNLQANTREIVSFYIMETADVTSFTLAGGIAQNKNNRQLKEEIRPNIIL